MLNELSTLVNNFEKAGMFNQPEIEDEYCEGKDCRNCDICLFDNDEMFPKGSNQGYYPN